MESHKTKQKIKQKNHRYGDQVSGYQRRRGLGGGAKWVAGINCVVMDDNWTSGEVHFVVYTGVEL